MHRTLTNTLNRAVILDRDGTLIEDTGYIGDPALVRLLPHAPEALLKLQRAGFLLVIVSNQSGIGRGIITDAQYQAVQSRLSEDLKRQGVQITRTYYCPHTPTAACRCRKPSPDLIFEAAKELGIDLCSSWMIGDKVSDVKAGQAAGCKTILFKASAQDSRKVDADISATPEYFCEDWLAVLSLFQNLREFDSEIDPAPGGSRGY